MKRTDEKKRNLVLKYWNLFPLITGIIPKKMKDDVLTIYSDKTCKELILNSLNKCYQKLKDEKNGTK